MIATIFLIILFPIDSIRGVLASQQKSLFMKKQVQLSAWKKVSQSLRLIPLVLRYGLILSLGLILVKTLEYQLFSYRFSMELYTGLLAVFFLLVGIATGLGWLQAHQRKTSQTQNMSLIPTGSSEPLTAKERNMLHGLIEGKTNQQLADTHYVSVNTIKTHLRNLYKKLAVSNRAEAVSKAKAMGLDT